MKVSIKALALFTIVGIALSILLGGTALADIVFDFHGKHALHGDAKAVLHLKDSYLFGNDLSAKDLISLSFTSSAHTFTVLPEDILTLYAALNIDGTLADKAGNFQFYLDAKDHKFLGIRTDGTWRATDDMDEGVLGEWSVRLQGFDRVCLSHDNFYKAAARGDVPYVQTCLQAGVPPNTQEGNGWTTLHSAAKHGKVEIIRLLLKHGANANVKDAQGRTALDQAVLANQHDAVAVLKNAR